MRLEGSGKFKNQMTSSGFEPATFYILALPLYDIVCAFNINARLECNVCICRDMLRFECVVLVFVNRRYADGLVFVLNP
jgi:hypothetical protein